MGNPRKNPIQIPTFLALCLLGAAIVAFAAPASAQDPVIQEIRIGVQDLETKQKLEQLPGGGTLRMEVGDRVRLRMVALPGGRHAPRYPSTRFWALAGAKRIALSNIDVEVGSVDVTAVSSVHGGNNQATTLIAFEIEDEAMRFVKPSMRGGTITVEVVEPPPPPPPPDPVRPQQQLEPGITLFEHQDFRGTAEKFFRDVRDLRGTRIGPDRASSVRIDRGCVAVLYEHPDFQGRSTVIRGSIEDLSRERVGNDTASAIRLDCTGRGIDDRPDFPDRPGGGYGDGGRGVTLYEHQDFQGDSETFSRDIRDLRGTRIREDRASSVEIDRGCEAILYEHPDFQGRATVVRREDVPDLGYERVGNDAVSSIRIDCSGRDDDNGPRDRGITLFEHQDFQGVSETFTRDIRDLRGTRIREDRASSVEIDRGCEAILFEHPDFQGRSTVVTSSIEDLRNERVGNDAVSSIRIDCFGRRR